MIEDQKELKFDIDNCVGSVEHIDKMKLSELLQLKERLEDMQENVEQKLSEVIKPYEKHILVALGINDHGSPQFSVRFFSSDHSIADFTITRIVDYEYGNREEVYDWFHLLIEEMEDPSHVPELVVKKQVEWERKLWEENELKRKKKRDEEDE